jgi:multiple sugar transport system ATP-binding protein
MRGIRKVYDNTVEVIKGVDLEVKDGEFMVFVGPSGCGKSTMMRMIAGLEDITDGELLIGDRVANDLPPVDRGVAMVFQSYALYPHMTVAENMGFGLKLAGASKQEVNEIVGKAAEILHITNLLDRRPKALSGGQRQRVAIGRAIVRKPGVFLFDEPLSNLDANLRVQMRVELTKLHKELGSTMIYVTHDQTEAMTMGDRIAVFNRGIVEQVGPPMELYHDPVNTFVAEFLGSPKMNLLPIKWLRNGDEASLDVGGCAIPWNGNGHGPLGSVSDDLLLGVRPEHFDVFDSGDTDGSIAAKVEVAERLGDIVLLYLKVQGVEQTLAVKVPEEGHQWERGATVTLRPREKSALLFTKAGPRVF